MQSPCVKRKKAYLTMNKLGTESRIGNLQELLEVILQHNRKCSLKVHFDGKRFYWDYTIPNVNAEDLVQK